jgi:hypothetical protein
VPESLIAEREKNCAEANQPMPATARRALGDFNEDAGSFSELEIA